MFQIDQSEHPDKVCMVLSQEYFYEAISRYSGCLNPVNSNPISSDFLVQPMMMYVDMAQFHLELRIFLA